MNEALGWAIAIVAIVGMGWALTHPYPSPRQRRREAHGLSISVVQLERLLREAADEWHRQGMNEDPRSFTARYLHDSLYPTARLIASLPEAS